MKNFVPLGTGNSRLMKSSIPAGTTWEQALAMLIAGTFPYDTGQLNAAGISQQGDPLNKNTLLKDATAQSYGLGTDAVPDDVLSKLSRFHSGLGNEYLWAKYGYEEGIILESSETTKNLLYNMSTIYISYSDEAIISNGEISLVSPTKIRVGGGNASSTSSVIIGKYIEIYQNTAKQAVGYCTSSTTASGQISVVYKKATVGQKSQLLGYVNSPDENAYPPSISDGYSYTAVGQLGDKAQIATGSYTGTNTYGSSDPNTLTFDFPVKVLIIRARTSNASDYGATIISGGEIPIESYSANTRYIIVTSFGTTVSWYSADAYMQLNIDNYSYDYVAIG